MRTAVVRWGLALMLLTLVAEPGLAQWGWSGREGRLSAPLREGLPERMDGFTFCRLWYTSVRREPMGLGWSTDYPSGDRNFTIRLGELTTARSSAWLNGDPGHAVVRATDPELFRCPFLFASDVGTLGFSAMEATRLREYLLKGGFLWVDDFWGEAAWAHWVGQIRRVLPEYPVVEITRDHPLLSVAFQVDSLPQIPSLQFWLRSGGQTSERGAETATANLRGIFDDTGRLLVLMTHNTDIADGWEREADDEVFFQLFSPDAYALGINIVLWIMTR